MKIGLVQNTLGEDFPENLSRAGALVKEAFSQGADVAVLPELFSCPYKSRFIRSYGETMTERTLEFLKGLAPKGKLLVGGSFPEMREGKIYNSSYVFQGEKVVHHHDKTYLYAADIPGKFHYDEGDDFARGEGFGVFTTDLGTFGLGVCFDVRFPVAFEEMALQGAEMIFVPGAFHETVAKAHWEPLLRARAIENQLFIVGVCPGRGEGPSRNYYGHSLVADPWGTIVRVLGTEEEVSVVEINLSEVSRIRRKLQIFPKKLEEGKISGGIHREIVIK